jgi:hypothetical protein
VATAAIKTDERGLVNKREREKRDSCNLGNMKEKNNNRGTERNILCESEQAATSAVFIAE